MLTMIIVKNKIDDSHYNDSNDDSNDNYDHSDNDRDDGNDGSHDIDNDRTDQEIMIFQKTFFGKALSVKNQSFSHLCTQILICFSCSLQYIVQD